MPSYRITYSTDAADEVVQADRVSIEAGGQVVLRQVVVVIGEPRDLVVRRLSASEVRSVDELDDCGRAGPPGR